MSKLSVKVKCVSVLLLPSLGTPQGRAVIMSLIAAILLLGPGINITHNLNNVVSNIVCALNVPYVNNNNVGLVSGSDDILGELRPVVRDLVLQERAWLSNVDTVCLHEMEHVFKDCEKQIETEQYDCDHNKTVNNNSLIDTGSNNISVAKSCETWLEGICGQVMTLVDTSGGDPIRNGIRSVQQMENTVKTIVDLKTLIENIGLNNTMTTNNKSDKSINYTGNQFSTNCSNVRSLQEQLDPSTCILWIIKLFGSLLLLSPMLLVIHSFMYLHRYLTQDRFDNWYITQSLKLLDLRNREAGKRTVLPILRTERGRYVDTTTFKLSQLERGHYVHGVFKWLQSVVAGGCVCLFDYSLYWILSLVDKCSPDDGSTWSFLSHVATLLNGSQLDCTKPPVKTDMTTYYAITATYIATFIMIFTQGYFMRIRRTIIAYYYPQRHMERNIHLLKEMLRKRRNNKDHLMRTLRRTLREKKLQENERLNGWETIKSIAVKGFSWEVKKPVHCLVCEDVENTRGPTYYRCVTGGCEGVYCMECVAYVDCVCVLCMRECE